MELMSPAGDWDAMRAAVANGADAVYFGLDNFNARHRAQNFTLAELSAVMKFLHDHNVKGFLTFNTLIFSDELEQAVDYIRQIALAGVDAVIVQDLGLATLIHALAPTLAIHGSTQMTLTEPRGIEFVASLGVSRVVLARELSLDDIARIAPATTTELEVFVHGALCVAYSGQCLTSESLGGRSANRGQCAQACRLPYELVVDGETRDLGDKAYLLSPQDLAAHDLIGDLANLGVACVKIEGRLKSAHYVAATTQTYRQAIDAAGANKRFVISPEQRDDLQQTFSRGFTHGFLSGVNHQQLVPARFPKARGVRIGTVARVSPNSILVNLDSLSALKPGDGVVFDEGHPEQDEQGGRIFEAHPRGKHRLEIELRRGDINLAAIATGAIVWRTDDPAMKKRLEHTFSRDTVARRRPIDVRVIAQVGKPLSIAFIDESNTATVAWEKPLEKANKFPATQELLREQLGRLGDSPYELRTLDAQLAGGPMIPKSVLNDLRRTAIEQLIRQRSSIAEVSSPDSLGMLRAKAKTRPPAANASGDSLHVLVRTMDQLQTVLDSRENAKIGWIYCDFEDIRRYRDAVELARREAAPIALATLRIIKPHEQGLLQQILDAQPDAVLVRNLAAIAFYREAAPQLPQFGDYSLNVSNELTADIFANAGLERMVPSYDLNWRQLSAMISRFDPARFECVIHQHMPMFHMEHCVFAHTLSNGKDYRDCGRPCERHEVDLRDRVGELHPLIPDVGCRNTVYNARAQSAGAYVPRMRELGVRHFRIELLRETGSDTADMIQQYADVLSGAADARGTARSLRVLSQLGVTAGTLERE
jgi:putative protease